MLNENYKDGTLSQLTYEYFDEVSTNAVVTTAADDTVFGNEGTEVEIKDTGVVSDIYVMLIPEGVDQILTGTGAVIPASMALMGAPLPLEEIELVASGQTIFSGKTSMLQLYGRVDPSSGHFTHSGFSDNTNHSLGVGLENVYRIQLGQDNHKNFCSGGVSMRELNAPKIRVKRSKTTPSSGGRVKARLHVVLRKHSVITTESSNGRVVSSLNN